VFGGVPRTLAAARQCHTTAAGKSQAPQAGVHQGCAAHWAEHPGPTEPSHRLIMELGNWDGLLSAHRLASTAASAIATHRIHVCQASKKTTQNHGRCVGWPTPSSNLIYKPSLHCSCKLHCATALKTCSNKGVDGRGLSQACVKAKPKTIPIVFGLKQDSVTNLAQRCKKTSPHNGASANWP